jgi:hypothetical protein
VYKSPTVTLLFFEKNEENIRKQHLFTFADSIDHCALLRYRIPSSFTLLDSFLQDPSLDVKNETITLLVFEKNPKNFKKEVYFAFKFADSIVL